MEVHDAVWATPLSRRRCCCGGKWGQVVHDGIAGAKQPAKRRARWIIKQIATNLLVSALMMAAWTDARADEGGASFWLPGQYASLAAVPPSLGWSLSTDAYFYSGKASVSEIFSTGGDDFCQA